MIIPKLFWFINVKLIETEPTGYILVFAQCKTLVRMSLKLTVCRILHNFAFCHLSQNTENSSMGLKKTNQDLWYEVTFMSHVQH
jgi:hypothetical protein